jgi:hypothetical protein
MKTRMLLLIVCIALSILRVQAQTPGVLHGTLIDNYLNNNPSPNHQVNLHTYYLDSLGNYSVVTTDSTYSDSLGSFSFNTFIGVNNYHDLSTFDCNGNYISQGYSPFPGSSLTIETCNNFGMCSASLSYTVDTSNTNTIHFSCPEVANASSFYINFGDGTTSTTSLTHTYSAANLLMGVYVFIDLVFSNGCVANNSVYIYNPNQGNCSNYFYYQQLGITNDIQFTSQPTPNAVTYAWDFGDSTTSNVANPIHTFIPNQSYFVTLITTDANGCSASSTYHVFVHDVCNVNISSYQLFDTTLTVQFYPLSNYYLPIDSASTLAWDFGDGSPIDTNYYALHQYATPGTYNACLSLITSSGCNINVCQATTVYDYTSSCSTTLSNYNDFTNSNDYIFSVISSAPGNSYYLLNATTTLDFGDGSTQIVSPDSLGFYGVFSFTHTYNAAGTYIVTATTTNSLGCVSSDVDTITVVMPAVYNCDLYLQTTAYSISMSGYTSSFSINVTNYAWSYGDGVVENTTLPYVNHTYPDLGDYQVCVTSTTANGCTSSSCDTVSITNYGSITGYTNTLGVIPPDSIYPAFVKVILIEQLSDSTNEISTVNVVAAQNTGSYYGYFQFDNVPPGNYTLLSVAYSDSVNVDTNFVPTYYVNAEHWEDASNTVMPGTFWNPYYLNLLPTYITSGNGEIGGFIGDGVFKSSNNAISKVHVIIYNENEEPVKHVLTDAQGRYNFKGLSMGTYHIYPEVVGIPTYRATVTISNDESMNMDVNFTVGDAVVASVRSTEKSASRSQVYPNPAKNVIHFVNENMKNIRITDVTGKLIFTDANVRSINYQVNTSEYSKGIYFYQIEMNDGRSSTGKFIKE